MKWLYVRPAFRGTGLGKQLAEAIIAEGCEIGYATMRLDTVPKLAAATKLYESLGFVRREAYYETPVGETIFMEIRLKFRYIVTTPAAASLFHVLECGIISTCSGGI